MMRILFLIILNFIFIFGDGQELYQFPGGVRSRVSSFENINGKVNEGAKTNKGAKGNAFEWMQPGESKTLLDIHETGIIQRIWLTVSQDKALSRSLRLQMWWDGDAKPAVDVPMIDFFGFHVGKRVSFESALFTSPEGRSYNCFIPMPFRKAAKIVLTNESAKDAYKVFFDVDYVLTKKLPENAQYFHAFWTRQKTSKLGDDFLVLPEIKGSGRYLGMSVGVIADSIYNNTWWGEGEVKMYLDEDTDYPTIAGTGAEDYVGTGWGMGTYHHQYQGCTVADPKTGKFSFYRWHIPDAIYFDKKLKITLQQIGGGPKEVVKALVNKGVAVQPVTIDANTGFVRLFDLEQPITINDEAFVNGWVNFYRVDDYVAVNYFYLDRTSVSLPALPSVEKR
jgi:hypothetical protein